MSDSATVARRKRGAPQGPPAAPLPRLPQVQRQRRLGLAGLAVLLIVGFGALAGALVLRSGDRASVVSVVTPVPAGAQIQRSDLGLVDVAVDDAIPTVPAAQLQSLVGRYATVPLISGTLLSPVALSETSVPGQGQAVVGLTLTAGQLPTDGIRSGDVLRIVRIPATGDATVRDNGSVVDLVLVDRAKVLQSRADSVNGGTSVTVLVGADEATDLAVAAARKQVAVIRVQKLVNE